MNIHNLPFMNRYRLSAFHPVVVLTLIATLNILGCSSGGSSTPTVVDDPSTLSRSEELSISALASGPAVNLTTARLASDRTLQEVLDKFGHASRAVTRVETPKTPLDYKESFISKMIETANNLRTDSLHQFKDAQGNVYQGGIYYALGAKDYTVKLDYKTQGLQKSLCTSNIHALDCSGMLAWCANKAGIPSFAPSLAPGTDSFKDPAVWNAAIPADWRLTMKKLTYSSFSELQPGDIVAWPGHVGFLATGAPEYYVAQSNGVTGDNDGEQCTRNQDRTKRGPRYVKLTEIVSGPGWSKGNPTVLRLEAEAAFTVELNWGAQPDVDLHVYEPGGSHVYYGSPSGTYGKLDVDDTTSYGPEHYIIDPTKIVDGDYVIGVNYYEGSGTETARLTITSGSQTKNYAKALTIARGSSGDDSPFILATIRVSKDAQGRRTIVILDGGTRQATTRQLKQDNAFRKPKREQPLH